MNEQVKELYDSLTVAGIGLGSEKAFERALSSDEGINEILDISKKNGFIPDTWNSDKFKKTFIPQKENAPKSALRNEIYSTLSDSDLQGKYNEMLEKAEQKKKEAIEKAKSEQDKFSKERPLLHAMSQADGLPMNIGKPVSGPLEALEQSDASFYLDEADKNEYNSLRKEIGVRNYESGFEVIKKSTEDEENRVKNIRANAELNGKLSAHDKSMLRKAEKINSDARELLEAGSKYGNESGIENWVDGLSNTLIDRDMIAGVGLIRDMKVDNLVEKLNNEEALSDAENALLLAAYNFEEVAKTRSFDLSTGYKIGQGTAESIPFVVDMLITRGLTGAGKTALLKLLASKGKDVVKLARVMDVSLDGSKVVRATTGEKLLHGAYELGETALQTAMMPSSQRQMMQEKTAIRKATGENDIALKDRARIFGNAYVQTFTERQGGQFVDWALGKMIPSGNLLARFGYKEGVLKSLNDIVQSPLSEVGEEYLGSAINLLRSIDLFKLYSKESNEDMRNEAMSQFSSEGFGEVVGTTLPISLLGGAANGIAIATKTNQFNKAHLAFGKMLEEVGATTTQSENILAQIEHASSQEEFNERLELAKGFLKKHVQETETDLGVANAKLKDVDKIVENYKNTATTFNNAIKDLRKLYAEMPQDKKNAMKADFENMRRKLNESITMTQQSEGPTVTQKKPTGGWQKRTMSVKIDGKDTKATFSGDVIFNEDGSINTSLTDMSKLRLQNDKGQNVRTTVRGEEAKAKQFETYLNAVNAALRAEKTDRDNQIAAQRKAEEVKKAELKRLRDEEKKKVEAENARIEQEKQAIAQQVADRQEIINSFQRDKNGEVDIDKMSPEQFFVYESDTDTPEAAMNTVGDVLDDLHQQLEDNTKETDKEKRARNAAKIRNRIRQYEAVVVKYAGQETLDAINAARAQALQNTPPVEEGPAVPPTQEPVVEPAQDETHAGPDTTPLPLPNVAPELEGTEGEEEGDGGTPAPDTLGDEGGVEGNEEGEEPAPAADKPTANLDEVTVWVAKNYDYIVTDKDGNTIFSSNPTRKKVTDAFEELHQVEGKVDGKRGTYNGEDCIIVRDNPAKGYVNIVTPHGIERVGRDEVMIDGKPLKGKASVVEWRENNEKKYDSFESIMNFPVFDIRGEMNITFLDFLNTQQDSPYVAFYEMLRKHYKEKYNDDVAQQYLDAGIARLITNLKEVARLWNIVRTKRLISSGKMTTTLERKKMESQSKQMKAAVAAIHNAVGIRYNDYEYVSFHGLDELIKIEEEKAKKIAKKKGNEEGYFIETDEEKAESYVDGLVSNILWVGFESENKHEHEDAVEGIVEALNMKSKKASKQRELVVNILNDRLEEAKRLNRLNDIQAIERVIDRLSTLKKIKPLLIEAGLIEEKEKKNTPAEPAPKKDTSKLVEQLSFEENSLRDMEEEYKTTTDAEEKSELEGYIAQAKEKIAKLKAEIDGAEFMVGDVVAEHAESTKRIIKILKAAGIRVVTFKNEDLPKYVSKKKLEELSDGQIVYGFASNDTIYLNEDHFNPNSPLHEFTHLWVTAYKQAFPNEWKRFVEIANKSALAANLRKPLKDGNASPYAKLSADEMASEVISRYTGYLYGELDAEGRTAFENMMQAQTMEEKIAEKSLLNRIRNIWKKIISWFDKSIENEKKEDIIDNMIRQFAQAPMETLARGKEGISELKRDAEYMDAVNRGDMETAQRLVNEAARMSMPNTKVVDENGNPLIVYHGSPYSNITTFDHTKGSQESGLKEFGTYFTSNPLLAELYKNGRSISEEMQNKIDGEIAKLREQQNSARNNREYDALENEINLLKQAKEGKVYPCFLNIEHPKEFDAKHQDGWAGWHELRQDVGYDVKRGTEAIEAITGNNKSAVMDEQYDGIIAHDIMDIHSSELKEELFGDAYLVWNPTQIKSAEPVTYDDNGNVIPLSERFNLEKDDIRYMIMLNNTSENLDNSKKSSTFVPTNKVSQREKAVAYSALFAKTKGEYTKGIDFASSSNYIHYFRNGEHIGAIEINGNEDLIKLINKEVYGINESTERFAEIAKTIGDEYRSNYRNHDRAERLGERNDRDDTVRSRQSSERGANQREVFTDNAEREQIIAEAKANGTYMLAPNGQPTNLTEDKWVTVRTQAFKDYFGDWQNDPANASVVVDESGEPMVVYHGSRMAGFDKFGRGEARDSQGIYTTPNRRAAESYATSVEEWKSGQTMPEAELGVPDHHGVYSLFVNMRNPKVIDFGGKAFDRFGTPKYEVATNEALDNGERGILFDTLEEAEAYIAEHPEEDLDYVEKYTTSDDLLLQAKEEGYDGVIFTNIIDSRYPDPITNYVPFEPNQVKSATQNVGTFNPEDDRIEFMIGPAIDAKQKAGIEKASNKLVKGIAANVPLPERMNELGKIWTEASDGGEVFRQLLKALREFNAKHGLGRKLPEGSDIRQVYTNSRSVLANKLRELANLYEKPLRKNLEELIEIVKVSSMYDKYKKEMRTVEEEVIQDGKAVSVLKQIEHELTPREFIERYLIACDNIERYQNGIPTRGLAMFKQWMGVDVIEFQAEFEAAFGASKEGEALLKNLWKSINDYTNYTLEDSFACEMITPEEYYRRKERKFYIPERDFAIDKDLEQPEVAPKKRYKSNKLSSSIKAKGGESLAANIIENIFYIGNTDLQKNNKNRVKLAMWNLLQANPEFRASIGLPRPEEVWYDRDGKRVTNAPTRKEREHMRLLQDEIFRLEYLLEEELSKEESLQDKAEIDSLKEELDRAYKERDEIPYMLEYEARHRFQSEGDPNLVGVYVNGTMCSMSFPNMSLAAIALNDAWDKSPNIWNPIRWIKGHISSVITAIEPAFFLKNVPTDGMSIILKGAVQYGWEFSLRYIATAKDILKHGKLVGTYVSGGDYRSLENGELFRDFLMNGGNTGYSSARNMDRILKELESLDRGHSGIKEAMEQSKKSLTFMNECTELLLRFAAYKTAIDMGKGVEEATNAANNLSANFNRRGERVPLSENVGLHTKAIYGFIRMFKELSMFYNPAMQGAMQFFRMFGESGALDTKEKVERWASIVVNAMFIPALAGFLNAMMFRDDDEEEWSVTEYDRANYLVIGKNGRFAMGHMTRPFYNIGVNIALHMQGRRDGGQIADSILTSFLTHLTPCAPSLSNIGVKTVHSLFGGQELNLWDYLQSFTTPEALAVFNEAADGVNFMGQQIKYDDEKIAMHTKNPNAGVIEKVLAKIWFCVGGGEWDGVTTLKRKGEGDVHDMFNVTPNEVRTFLSLLMPKTFIDTGNVIAGAVQNVVDKQRGEYIENNIKLKNIPFFNTFISERTPEAYRNGIYSEANKIARANKLIMDKAYKEMVRISVKMNNELSDEEYRDLEKRYEHFEAIYKQAAGDVIAGTLREILPAYKEVRFSNIQKRFSMSEKELRKYLSDIDYDSLEESERELIFNMSQLVQMKKGCGPINSKIPQWMKGVFNIEPTSQEVQELWDMYEENQQE